MFIYEWLVFVSTLLCISSAYSMEDTKSIRGLNFIVKRPNAKQFQRF